MAEAKCFMCLEPQQSAAARLQLLCDMKTAFDTLVANGIQGAPGTPGADGATGADGADGPVWTPVHSTLNYNANVNVDFTGDEYKTVTLAGNIDFDAVNHTAGSAIVVRILCDASPRNLTFNAGWKFVGNTAPASIVANKVGILSLTSFGVNDANVIAAYAVQI
jgi:hypothetical protein